MNSATTTMVVPRRSHPDGRLGPAAASVPTAGSSIAASPRVRRLRIGRHRPLALTGSAVAPRAPWPSSAPGPARSTSPRPPHRCTWPSFSYSRARSLPATITGSPTRSVGDDALSEAAPADHAEEQLGPVDPRLLSRSNRRSVLASRKLAFSPPSLNVTCVTVVATLPTTVTVVSYISRSSPPRQPRRLDTEVVRRRRGAATEDHDLWTAQPRCGQLAGHKQK